MKNKIQVVMYCNELAMGGTTKTAEIFGKYLDKEKFSVRIVSKKPQLPVIKKIKIYLGALLGVRSAVQKKKNYEGALKSLPQFQKVFGADKIFLADEKSLKKTILELKPDVLHVHYSGIAELPIADEEIVKNIPVTVTTNQFEIENKAPSHKYVKKILFVSQWLKDNKAHWVKNDSRADVLYNPIEKPFIENENLRDKLGIPKDAFVFGRVGRADNGIHDPISLKAYQEIQNSRTWFLALSPPTQMVEDAKNLNLQNFVVLDPIMDPKELSRFYNTIDVLLHARRDGETFGCNIAEAMIHGKPVVSHISEFMNAQIEVIADTGFVVDLHDFKTYAEKMKVLMDDKSLYEKLSVTSRKRSLELFEAGVLTSRLEKIYLDLLGK